MTSRWSLWSEDSVLSIGSALSSQSRWSVLSHRSVSGVLAAGLVLATMGTRRRRA